MAQRNTVFFISDLHLSAQNPEGFALFLRFLEGPARHAYQLYILGDLFDVWVGEDIDPQFQQQVQQALKSLALSGVAIFFMNGNRDFLVSTSFLKGAHCQKLMDPFLMDLHGIPTLLTHGDKLCTQDIAYQRYRAVAQHPITRKIFLSLPKQMRQNIGSKLRQKSLRYQNTKTLSFLDVSKEGVIQWMIRHHVKQLIHGHVHQPHIHDIDLVGNHCKRLVLGDWHESAVILSSTPSKMALLKWGPELTLQPHSAYALEALDAFTAPFTS